MSVSSPAPCATINIIAGIAMCFFGGAYQASLAAAEAFASHPDGLNCLLDAGAVGQVLGTLMAVQGYTNVYHSRLAAVNLLGKFLWNPVKGGDASAMLRRYCCLAHIHIRFVFVLFVLLFALFICFIRFW